MFAELVNFFFVPALLAVLTLRFFAGIYRNWKASKVPIIVTEKSGILTNQLTIFYKYVIYPEKNAQEIVEELSGILPKSDLQLIKIFYDDPKTVKKQHCQSAIGCIYQVNDDVKFEENFSLQLTRWGFERMVLPKVERAVYSKKPVGGLAERILGSVLDETSECEGKIDEFARESGLNCPIFVHIIENENGQESVNLFKPLDSINEFIVPEYKSFDELESKLNRRKFDSDESDSESDASGLEDEGTADEAVKDEAENDENDDSNLNAKKD